MYPYFFKKQDQTENQLGFQRNNYCVNQLLVNAHDIFLSFDDQYEVPGIFRDISKVFNKVWLKKVIHQLKHNGILGNLLRLLTNFLTNKK